MLEKQKTTTYCWSCLKQCFITDFEKLGSFYCPHCGALNFRQRKNIGYNNTRQHKIGK